MRGTVKILTLRLWCKSMHVIMAQLIRLPASGFARHWNGRRSAGGAAALLLLRRRFEIISQGAHPAALEPFARRMRPACVPRMLRHAFPVLWLLAYGTASLLLAAG